MKKLWKYVLLALLCMAPAMSGLAQDGAAEAVAEVVEAVAEAAGEVDENKVAYDEMIAAHGATAYAFDFFALSMVWTIICAALVFLMHLGFATLEAGLTRAKNTVNILFKNVFIISIGLITYAILGFNTHYPGDFNGFFSIGGPIGDLNADGSGTFAYGGVALCMTGFGDFIFQAMFAATAATIVSGAVAERINLKGFMIYATILVGIGYPVAGSWHWGGGFLSAMGTPFKDFAGSSAVHAFGGFAALAAVLVLGPRRGKYIDGKIKPILGHSMPLATIGVLLLWLGWFGFNGGSVLSAEPMAVGLVITTTCLAAAAGALASILTSAVMIKTPDLSMALNGILAGLVGITAGADVVTVWEAVIIGAIAGVIVVPAILFFDKAKIDDPVGAVSVHGVCGVWGTLAVGIFGGSDFSFMSQLIGTLAFGIFAFILSLILAIILKSAGMWRVDAEEEEEGLDIAEHGSHAYPDFVSVAEK